VLEVSNIYKSYHQAGHDLHVLKGIDLKISEGEMVAIVGPSGAGKSTLLHIMGGLDNPDQGRVVLEGEEIYKFSDEKRAKIRNLKIGFVFQFYHLLPEFSALENVLLPVLVKENQSQIKRFESLGVDFLTRVGLADRSSHKPNQLSGGEQQRVAIARALINQPKLILCDEPTGNLDSETGQEVIKLLVDLNQKNKQTIVIVTHDASIAKLAHRVIYIRDGQLNK